MVFFHNLFYGGPYEGIYNQDKNIPIKAFQRKTDANSDMGTDKL